MAISTNVTTNRAVFLYCVLRGLNTNVGQVIADEIKHYAHAVSNKSPLEHPSLITHLSKLAGVNTSTPLFECPRKEIDASYYTQYCMLDEAGIPMPAPQPPRPHRRAPQQAQQDQAQDATPFQMRDMYMSLMESKMEALYQGEQALLMTVKTPASVPNRIKSQEDFMAHVAWPTDPTQGSGGAGASGATRASGAAVMKEDAEDEGEEEDEDEEEDDDDSDDNKG
ncbi:hypothetical protein LR48_Vigan05g086300 [Vigna angularis]|uniref:Putative plant transposon protein domain-containing protein n=1 Tax=Phaseolus angularis TaxID=3914 RepID=A0A0L9UL22_PHAAN|nr:hypothetical protein LR48_Vigan05g086300 [Vigna angularis]